MKKSRLITRFGLAPVCVLGVLILAANNDGAATAKATATDVLEQNKKLLRRAHAEVWSKGNFDLVDELYAKDYVCHFIDGIEWKGSDGLRQEVAGHRTSFPDWKEEIVHIVSEGPFVVTLFKCTGTNKSQFTGKPATGRKIEIMETAIHRIVDGKIVEQWGFPDVPTMQKQLYGEAP